ncbi:MAG: hypothetical protein RLZZ189_668, partial [Pseudomonadota bacterium]
SVSVFFHRTAGVPDMEGEGFVGFVDHGQANAAQMRLVRQLAVFFPAVQGGQWVELAFDRPISTDDGIGSVKQPNTHDALQHV